MKATTTPRTITQAHLDRALSYAGYRALVDELMAENKTTGENHSPKMLDYTALNVKRMAKWDKIGALGDDITAVLGQIGRPQYWVVLTEAWCGDAAQNIPFMQKMAEANDNITLKLLMRDENLPVMDQYLTNGGRSIPKLVVLDGESLAELATWGPRPAQVQAMLAEHKQTPDEPYEAFAERAHAWYAKDRGKSMQAEMATAIRQTL